MTVEDCRTIIKVHIMAAESIGKIDEAFALLEGLVAIDGQILHEHCALGTHGPQS